MVKVSVAIPVYNAAKHLDVTFDSLMNQTMPASDFEIICVNDCSTDNSKEVIKTYQQKMPNLVLIDRATNSGGPSAPRNDAIEAARGQYIHFLDSDDFLGEEALERLYRAARQHKSDIIFGKYIAVNGRRVPTSMFKNGNRPKADIIADDLVYTLAPHKMFSMAFLKETGFRFRPDIITANEDMLFIMQCYVAAQVITVLADYSYYFVVARGDESISAKIYEADQWYRVYYYLMDFLDAYVKDKNYRHQLKVAFLNRLLKKSRVRSYLLTQKIPPAEKASWLQETKRFIDTHINEQIMRSLDPRLHPLLQAAKENDMQKIALMPWEGML